MQRGNAVLDKGLESEMIARELVTGNVKYLGYRTWHRQDHSGGAVRVPTKTHDVNRMHRIECSIQKASCGLFQNDVRSYRASVGRREHLQRKQWEGASAITEARALQKFCASEQRSFEKSG